MSYPQGYDVFLEDVLAERRYEREKKREKKLDRLVNLESGNLPSLIYDYQPPYYVDNVEAYSLFHFMITGIPTQTHYLNPRHKWIHHAIESMKSHCMDMGTTQLINYLHDAGWIKWAGGEWYVKKLFKDLDVQNVLYGQD